MATVLIVHSVLRWLIVAAALLASAKFIVGWLRGMRFGVLDKGFLAGFSAMMDLQILVGLIYLFWNGLSGGGFPHYRFEHMLIMLIAAAIAHLPARWKDLGDRLRFRRSLFAVFAALAVVIVGVARLPGGWTR